jgi:predicted dehydrogenase
VVTTERFVLEADLLNKRLYQRDFTTPSPSVVAVKPADQLTEELKAFIAAIKGRGELICQAEEVVAPLRLAEEITKTCS